MTYRANTDYIINLMVEGETRQHLKVFIGYAADVEEELTAVLGAIKRVNTFGEGYWLYHLDPWHWKLEPAEAGRPQAHINQHVDTCHFFVGIVGTSWGTQRDTRSKYTSGFHEEFHGAWKRHQNTGEPEILLFFKKMPRLEDKDKSHSVKQIISFRKEVREADYFLDKDFTDASDLATQVYDDLMTHLKRRDTERESRSRKGSKGEVTATDQLSGVSTQKTARAELAKISGELEVVLSDESTDIEGSQSMPIATSDVSRIMMLLDCWMSQYQTGELLGSHQINLLYLHRQGMQLLSRERQFVLRNLFGNQYAPGWYWLRDVPRDSLLEAVERIAMEDAKSESRVQAVRWLTDAKIGHNNVQNWDTRMLSSALSDGSSDVRTLALRYVSEVASESDLEAVRSELGNEQLITPEAAFEAELYLRLRYDVKVAFRMGSKEPEKVSSQGADALAKHITTVDEKVLFEVASTTSKDFATVATEELARRGSLTETWINDHLPGASLSTRSVFCLELVRTGIISTSDQLKAWREKWLQDEMRPNFPGLGSLLQRVPGRDLESALLSKYTFANLKGEVAWLSEHGYAAYEVLCEKHWDEWADRVRSDLEDGFASLKDEWLASARDKLKNDVLRSLSEQKPPKVIPENIRETMDQKLDEEITRHYTLQPDVEQFVKSSYIKAALGGISTHGCKDDVRFFRQYLNHQNAETRLAALVGLKHWGDTVDVKPMLALVNDEDPRVRHLAAEIAVHLAPGIDGAAVKLFDFSDPLIPGTGIKALLDTDIKHAADLVRPLLGHSEYAVRRDAFIFFKRRYSGDQLEQLLDDYISSGGYHYDVVCWLDRHLYGPDFFRKIGS